MTLEDRTTQAKNRAERCSSSYTQPATIVEDVVVFKSFPASFKPSIEWLDGSSPLHPYFNDARQIQSVVTHIKDEVLTFALEGCQLILQSLTIIEEDNYHLLIKTLNQVPELWRAVILTQHYGVIYFMSRSEARSRYHPLMRQSAIESDAIDRFLRSHDSAGIRAMNYAIHAFVTRGNLRVDYATSCIPPNAIAAIGPRHVVVRAVDFDHRSASDVLAFSSPMWDLHDIAHLSCATISQELYGNKYQKHLIRLPKELTALIRSPGMRTATGPIISDGLVFSELLSKLFTDSVTVKTEACPRTYRSLCTELATLLAEYFLCKRALQHPSTGSYISLPQPVSSVQLAVLVQNKSYELPASEIEQRVFTRGGPIGAKEDILLDMTGRERAAWLATSNSWSYFEVRNTIKHRAHKESYELVCRDLMERATDAKEKKLLQKIRRNLRYEDWEEGERVILWDLLQGTED
ncbi:hypothetical protein F5B22DRAFT_651567 [Xylaria bambusicola]|uniref:uncharacterized protein n=1 Tax=Xylaria bambusicola TaxID=326684 RepID=UPI00200762A1|nr:uncharacterized protein F5B22DRAFT_651567 [Xylaria bambusicola]KAI0505634.1 hypothetical protein F5B22DRAFT_651567 [Xylaria bambusicola]